MSHIESVAEAIKDILGQESPYEEKLIRMLGVIAIQLSAPNDRRRIVASMAAQIAGRLGLNDLSGSTKPSELLARSAVLVAETIAKELGL